MKLYFSRNPNPRLAVAVARFLELEIDFEYAAPQDPDQGDRYRHLNPNLLVPILAHERGTLWETDAIACRLSRAAGADFWRTDDDEPEMIRWISWANASFVKACDMVHWELGTKLRYGIGATDAALVEEGLQRFHQAAAILDSALADRPWLLGDSISYADFRMATFLPYNDVAQLPVGGYPAVARWNGQLHDIAAWSDPFHGLDAPPLSPITD